MMPISENVFDNVMKQMIGLCKPEAVLDIGPGAGKYGRMLCDIENETGRAIHKICIEIDEAKIIKRFNLHSIYNEVINEDAATIVKRYSSLTGDLAIAGDVIEHLTKSDGVDLIEYLQYRFKYIFLVIPVDWISYSFEDYDYESHVSIWRTSDIQKFEGGYCVERLIDSRKKFLLCTINGLTIPAKDHFVVRNKNKEVADHPLFHEADLEFGFLNC